MVSLTSLIERPSALAFIQSMSNVVLRLIVQAVRSNKPNPRILARDLEELWARARMRAAWRDRHGPPVSKSNPVALPSSNAAGGANATTVAPRIW